MRSGDEGSRLFATSWNPGSLRPDVARMVDLQVLEDLWRTPNPHAGTMMLAQLAWLDQRNAAAGQSGRTSSLRGSAQSPSDAMSCTVSSRPCHLRGRSSCHIGRSTSVNRVRGSVKPSRSAS